MFERFTERGRRVMGLARQEAQRLKSEFIDTEHILLGILLQGDGVAVLVLKNFWVHYKSINLEIEKLITPSTSPTATLGQLPFSPRAKRVIERAAEAASQLGQDVIGTEHLLLGILKETEGITAQAFKNTGLKSDEVREMLLKVIAAQPKAAPWSTRVLKVSELSMAEAERMGSPTVEPEHLLLGILAESGPAAGLLSRSGITAEAIRGILPRP